MDGFEFNKIAGAVLGTALGVMAVSIISDFIYEPRGAEEPGYVIALATSGGEGIGAPVVETIEPISVRLQVANAAAGETTAKKCAVCHTFEPGGAAKVGPNLYGIVGAQAAHMDNFAYSQALRDRQADGQPWTFEALDTFLANPRGAIPGTAMAFAGLKGADERADMIAYLRTLADNPVPLPDPPADEPAPADGEPAPQHSDPLPPPADAAPDSPAPTAPL